MVSEKIYSQGLLNVHSFSVDNRPTHNHLQLPVDKLWFSTEYAVEKKFAPCFNFRQLST